MRTTLELLAAARELAAVTDRWPTRCCWRSRGATPCRSWRSTLGFGPAARAASSCWAA